MSPTTPPPHQVAREAANTILTGLDCSEREHEQATALILSAAAKMVHLSGAVAALELTEKLSPDMKSTREAAVAAMTALDRLRSITGEAGDSQG